MTGPIDPGAPESARWPTIPVGTSGPSTPALFQQLGREQLPSEHHLSRQRIALSLVVGLATLSGLLVLVVVLLRPGPPPPCHLIVSCHGPTLSQPIANGTKYTSSQFGFTLHYQDSTKVQNSPNGVVLTYGDTDSQYQGSIQVVGEPANGLSSAQIVTQVQQQVVANADPEYAVPDPFIGYVPASGEAYNFTVNGSSNSEAVGRIIILAAVQQNLAIVVIVSGPYVQFSASNMTIQDLDDFPSPADQFGAIFADPIVNSITWPGQSLFGSAP